MNGLAQLVLREVVTRRQVFLLAAIIAPMPFLLPYLPALKSYDPGMLRVTSALALAAGFSVALSLILGATVIGRDLSEGRFGFYFSRPLSGLTLWAGKMIGALVLIAAVVLIVLLPTVLSTLLPGAAADRGRGVFLELFETPSMASFLICVLLLLGLAHAVSMLARAQSAWIVLPFAVGIAAASVAWHSAIRVVMLGNAFVISSLLLVGGLLVSLFASGLLQVLLGRADLKRGARVLALALTCGLLISTLIHAGYSAWLRTTSPTDLASIDGVLAGGEGSWVYLTGDVKRGGTSYSRSFLFDTASGRWFCTGPLWNGASLVAFTPDGRRAVWVQYAAESLGDGLTTRIWAVDLGEPDNRPELVLELDEWVRTVAISTTGNRLALVTGHDLQVFDLNSGRLLAAARTCRDLRYHRIIFRSPERVRFYRTATRGEMSGLSPDPAEGQAARGGVVIDELDVVRGEFQRMGIIANAASGLYRASWSRDGKRMAIRVDDGETFSLFLHDARTGEQIMPLGRGYRSGSGQVMMLFDGRIAVLRETEGRNELALFSPEGTELRSIRIAEGWTVFNGEVAPGMLALSVALREPGLYGHSDCYLADLDDGHCRRVGRDIVPAMGSLRDVSGVFGAWPSPGSPGSGLYIEGGRYLVDYSCLVRLDPRSGERVVILELQP